MQFKCFYAFEIPLVSETAIDYNHTLTDCRWPSRRNILLSHSFDFIMASNDGTSEVLIRASGSSGHGTIHLTSMK